MPRRSRAKGVYKGKKGKPVVEAPQEDTDPVYDEVDRFAEQSDTIDFGKRTKSKDKPENRVSGRKQSVMQIAAERYQSSDEDDLDDDDDSDDVVSSEDEEEREIKSKKQDQKIEEKFQEWGRLGGKAKYHGTDVQTGEEKYEAAIAEEEEALHLQKKRADKLKNEDFAVEEDNTSSDDDDQFWDEAEQQPKYQSVAKTLDSVSLTPKKASIELVTIDNSKLTQKEKLQIIENDAPELLGLLADFKSKINELKSNVQPLLSEVSKKQLPTTEGISFLETKFHLLLNYCMNIGFYMLLKAEGKPIQDHPVVHQLVKLRLLIEKTAPIDQKLRYQVQKLTKMTADVAEAAATSNVRDPLLHKPNLASFEQDEEDMDGAGVYKLKKVAPTNYDDDKKKRKAKRVKTNTAMTDFIQEEFSTAPQEVSYSGKQKMSEREQYEENFEEENFIRLSKNVKTRKNKEKDFLHRSELDDPLDVRDILTFDEENAVSGGKLAAIIQNAEKPIGRAHAQNGEEDIPYQVWERRANKRTLQELNQSNNRSNNNNNDDDEEIPSSPEYSDAEDNQYYQQVTQAKKKRKLDHEQQLHNAKEINYYDDKVNADKRGIPFAISANRGLTRDRAKKYRNSRVRYREAADKKMKKLKTAGRVARDKTVPYAGEQTGIRKGIKRSVNFS